MATKPDERLIVLLPPDLLEQLRRAAEEADLSVSQVVRRAIRNELKWMAADGNVDAVSTARQLARFVELWQEASRHDVVPGEITTL